MIVGIRADGTLGVIVVDGRGPYDKGLTSQEAGILCQHYGYQFAGNLDGGGSATLATNSRALLDALDIDVAKKVRNYHVADMSADYAQRVIHHGVAIKVDVTKILPFYKINHIPKDTPCDRRPGDVLNATTLTIHNTGNPKSKAAGERANLTRSDNLVTASFHIVVDDIEAIECIPLSERAWHAGDGTKAGGGNMTSLSMEICESGDYEKAEQNAVELAAGILKARGWGVDHLRRHYDWTKKICPRMMYDANDEVNHWKEWDRFKSRVNAILNPPKPVVSNKVDITVDGEKLAVQGTLENGTTTAPVREVVEALGANIRFDNTTRTVIITSN
jgi:hypothetical protein